MTKLRNGTEVNVTISHGLTIHCRNALGPGLADLIRPKHLYTCLAHLGTLYSHHFQQTQTTHTTTDNIYTTSPSGYLATEENIAPQ